MVLGLLARHGPRHGHQIRRDAEQTEVGSWGGVSVGALYRELRGMEEEGLLEALRTEQVGRRPARTIYQITDEGRRELRILREQAIRDLYQGPDALSVALLFGGIGDREVTTSLLAVRRKAMASALEDVTAECAYLQSKGYIGPLEAAMFRRKELFLQAELRWHDAFDKVLADLPDDDGRTEPNAQPTTEA